MALRSYPNKKKAKEAIIEYLREHGKGTAREIQQANPELSFEDIVRTLQKLNGLVVKSEREKSVNYPKTWRLV